MIGVFTDADGAVTLSWRRRRNVNRRVMEFVNPPESPLPTNPETIAEFDGEYIWGYSALSSPVLVEHPLRIARYEARTTEANRLSRTQSPKRSPMTFVVRNATRSSKDPARQFADWLGGRDSNPDNVVQSHVSYR